VEKRDDIKVRNGSLGNLLDRSLDVVVAGGLVQLHGEVDNRHVGSGHPEGHARQLAVQLREHLRNGLQNGARVRGSEQMRRQKEDAGVGHCLRRRESAMLVFCLDKE
jgi:hypothetical protein